MDSYKLKQIIPVFNLIFERNTKYFTEMLCKSALWKNHWVFYLISKQREWTYHALETGFAKLAGHKIVR